MRKTRNSSSQRNSVELPVQRNQRNSVELPVQRNQRNSVELPVQRKHKHYEQPQKTVTVTSVSNVPDQSFFQVCV